MKQDWVRLRIANELKLDETRANRRNQLLVIIDVSGKVMTVDEFLVAHEDHDEHSWWTFVRKDVGQGPWQIRRYFPGRFPESSFESETMGEEWLVGAPR